MKEQIELVCGYCGKTRWTKIAGFVPMGWYRIERDDGDIYAACSLDHAMALLGEWADYIEEQAVYLGGYVGGSEIGELL